MNIFIISPSEIRPAAPAELARISSLAVGCFDGLHLAHMAIISQLDERGALLCIDKDYQTALLPHAHKPLFAARTVLLLRLADVRHMSAREFAEQLRAALPGVRYFVQGYDFRFGAQGAGLPADLGASVRVLSEMKISGISVHSTEIRRLLAGGYVERAAELLGRLYGVCGPTVRGQGLGSRELVATINIDARGWILPADGVYLCWLRVDFGDAAPCPAAAALAAPRRAAAVFIGTRSSDGARSLEAHIIEPYSAPDHGERYVWCEFRKRLRESKKLPDLAALRAQILADLAQLKDENERSDF